MSNDSVQAVVSKIPAAIRLRTSRERLRDAMTPPPEPPAPPPAPPTSFQRWARSLRSVPVVGEVSQALGTWWSTHPFRPVARMVGEASRTAALPVAHRHPVALVGASAAVGAVLFLSKPWKWALRSALFAGLAPQLASRVLKKLPMQSWLAMLGTVLSSSAIRREPSTAAAGTTPWVTKPAPPPNLGD